MEKISIARRRMEKQQLPFTVQTNTIGPYVKMKVFDDPSCSLLSSIIDGDGLLQTGKKEFMVEIISGWEKPLKVLVSIHPQDSPQDSIPLNKNFLTVKEAAQVSEKTIYRQLRSGHLKGQKIGRQWRVISPSLKLTET